MRTLEKVVTLGDKKFKVGVDRNIAVKTFEENPEVLEYLISKKDLAKEKMTEESFFLQMLKKKELGNMFSIEDKIEELIAFALPLMLEKANESISSTEIIDYAKENGASSLMNSAMLELLMQAFFQGELEKPKIKFSMK